MAKIIQMHPQLPVIKKEISFQEHFINNIRKREKKRLDKKYGVQVPAK